MATQEQVYGFYIPTVTLMGIGAYKDGRIVGRVKNTMIAGNLYH